MALKASSRSRSDWVSTKLETSFSQDTSPCFSLVTWLEKSIQVTRSYRSQPGPRDRLEAAVIDPASSPELPCQAPLLPRRRVRPELVGANGHCRVKPSLRGRTRPLLTQPAPVGPSPTPTREVVRRVRGGILRINCGRDS